MLGSPNTVCTTATASVCGGIAGQCSQNIAWTCDPTQANPNTACNRCNIMEPLGGAHRVPQEAIAALGDSLAETLRPLLARDGISLRAERRRKFLAIGPKQ